jgi:hypothetical protein
VAQTACPKCRALISDDDSTCPACGVSKDHLSAEVATLRSRRPRSSRLSIFRWKRDSVDLLKFLIIALAISLAFRWLLGTYVLGKGFLEGWWQ